MACIDRTLTLIPQEKSHVKSKEPDGHGIFSKHETRCTGNFCAELLLKHEMCKILPHFVDTIYFWHKHADIEAQEKLGQHFNVTLRIHNGCLPVVFEKIRVNKFRWPYSTLNCNFWSMQKPFMQLLRIHWQPIVIILFINITIQMNTSFVIHKQWCHCSCVSNNHVIVVN